MKKKWTKYLTLLCVMLSVFSLTACSEEKSDKITYNDETAEIYVKMMKEYGYEVTDIETDIRTEVDGVVDSIEMNLIYQDRDELLELYADNEENLTIAESYLEATKDLGEYKEDSVYNLTFEITEETMTTTGSFEFEERDLNFTYNVDLVGNSREFIFEKELTLPEILEKAGMNTLLGMGTVFLVLILISGVIACLGFVAIGSKKSENETKKEVDSPAQPVPANIQNVATSSQPAGLPDEVEMAIVIATAIAAAEEETGSDGYRVSSIKRAKNSKWRRA